MPLIAKGKRSLTEFAINLILDYSLHTYSLRQQYMKVIDHIEQAKGTLVSFEVLPPLKGKSINSIYDHLDPLMEFKPSFINVTYHRSETGV